MTNSNQQKSKASKVRRVYIARLVGRCIVFAVCVFWYIYKREEISQILQKWNFFNTFSAMHLLWGIWVIDMFCQLVPVKNHISIGSQKLFKERFRPITDKINYQA